MTSQLEFINLNDNDKMFEIYKRLLKLEKKENGAFKMLSELKKERMVIAAEIEEITHEQIYG